MEDHLARPLGSCAFPELSTFHGLPASTVYMGGTLPLLMTFVYLLPTYITSNGKAILGTSALEQKLLDEHCTLLYSKHRQNIIHQSVVGHLSFIRGLKAAIT